MKRTRLLFLVIALVSFILLAVSLSNLQLQPGTPFPGGGDSEGTADPANLLPPIQTYALPLLQGIFAFVFLLLMIYVLAKVIASINIKRILPLLLVMGILLVLVYLLPDVTPDPTSYRPSEYFEVAPTLSFEYPVTPLGRPPQPMIQLVLVGIMLGIGLLAILVIKRRLAPTKIEDVLLQDAEEAVKAIQDGVDLRNVIVRCYLQMTRSIQEEQGIERNYTMTVQEFERWLEGMGFPSKPMQQLTSLFEKVRYGKQKISNNDEQIAVNSLNEIIRYCKSEGHGQTNG